MSGAGTTDAYANVIIGQIFLGNLAQLRFEGRREEQIVVIRILICIYCQVSHIQLPTRKLSYLHRT